MTLCDLPLTLKILTVNTHKGFTAFNRRFMLHELREAIRSTDADVVFLQEVLGEHQRHAQRQKLWPQTSQYEFLADTIWSDFAYGQNAVYPSGHHGNAVLSKFPIARYTNRDISVGKHEKRGLLHCVLSPPGGMHDIHAVCVHLGLQEKHRRLQTADLCRLIEEEIPSTAPLVIAGDFNDWRKRAQQTMVEECGMTEVFQNSYGRLARTFPANFPILRLDRIYVRNMSVAQPVVLEAKAWRRLSDHAPLAVKVCL